MAGQRIRFLSRICRGKMAIWVLGNLLLAQSSMAGINGYEFLRNVVGARPAAMGGTFVAISGDVNGIYYNPASVASVASRQASVSYLNSFLDFQSGFAALGIPLGTYGYAGMAAHYFNYGEFIRSDKLGNELGTMGAGDFLLILDYGYKITRDFYIGVSFKTIYSSLAEYTSTAFAGDFGFQYRFPDQELIFGFSLFNLGKVADPYIDTKDRLPTGYRAGFSKRLAHLPLLLSGEIYQYKEEDLQFSLGGEFTITPSFLLRVGYNSIGREQRFGKSESKFAGISFGAGISLQEVSRFRDTFWQNLLVDYSYSSAGQVGSLNRFTIGFHF